MKKCTIHYTGICEKLSGVIQAGIVFGLDEGEDSIPLEEAIWWSIDCENGLAQIEVDGKWGFANIHTGEITIEPQWDYVSSFSNGFAHVSIGCVAEETNRIGIAGTTYNIAVKAHITIEGGKHGFIDYTGNEVIPCIYDNAYNYNRNGKFIVIKDNKGGVIDKSGTILSDFRWDRYLNYDEIGFLAAEQNWLWAILNHNGELIIDGLTERPYCYEELKATNIVSFRRIKKYWLIRKGRKFGVVCEDGRLITNPTLLKREAVNIIKKLGDF